ncbi:MAG: protein translocase subunit SecF [Gammaproteobacteria bacterium]
MRLIKEKTSIDFLSRGRRLATTALSILAIIVSLSSITLRGLEFGIDFTGGVLLEVAYPQAADLERIRRVLSDAGFTDVQVQRFGTETDVLVRLPPQSGSDADAIRESLSTTLAADEPGVVLRRVEIVGPQVGKELQEQGGLATIFVLLLIFAYVMMRFQWKFAAGAVAALAHDVILTVGFFSIFRLQFDLTVLAAVLAVIGYSLNDTVVAFDRIRENFVKFRGSTPEESMNASINEMLARTVITGVTTLLVLSALFSFGGEAVAPFSIALIVGVIVGTYSSIYTASATALYLDVSAQDLLPPAEDAEFIDDLP